MSEKRIWVLTDHRTGNSKQAIAAAKILRLPYEEIRVGYNILGILPNCMKDCYAGLDRATKKLLKTHIKKGTLPDVVISAGRRTAMIGKLVKKHKSSCKFVQIMQPNLPLKYIDFLILPRHDVRKCKEHIKMFKNQVHYSHGALVHFDKEKSAKMRDYWKNKFPKEIFDVYPERPIISVLVGGSSQPYVIAPLYIEDFIYFLEKVARKNNASLLISTSRRTPRTLAKKIHNKILYNDNIEYYIYDYHKKRSITRSRSWQKEEENPYEGILEWGDYMVLTADSVSMASEACATGKPLYLFIPHDVLRQKHRDFVDDLYDNKLAKPLIAEKFTDPMIPIVENNNELKEKLLHIINSE